VTLIPFKSDAQRVAITDRRETENYGDGAVSNGVIVTQFHDNRSVISKVEGNTHTYRDHCDLRNLVYFPRKEK
jgi:hypothetical protein